MLVVCKSNVFKCYLIQNVNKTFKSNMSMFENDQMECSLSVFKTLYKMDILKVQRRILEHIFVIWEDFGVPLCGLKH